MRGAALLGGVAAAVGVSAVAFHPVAGVGIVLGIAIVAWALSSALNATLAFIIVLVLRPADHFPVLAAMQPAKVVGVIAILSWLISKLFKGDMKLPSVPQGKWMVALTVGIMLSATFSTNPRASWELFFDVFIKMLVMFGLVVFLVNTKQQAAKFQLSLALCTVALALLAIHLRSSGLATIEGNRAGLVGLLGDPNDLALVLVMYVPLFAELVVSARGLQRLVSVIFLTILVFGIFATVSRGGALALMAALTVTWYDRGPLSMRLLLVPAIGALVVGMLLLAGVNERTSGVIEGGELDASAQGRLDMWQSGVRMTVRHPLFGVGFGEFPDNFLAYSRDPVVWEPRDAHNSFIKAAAETGVVGFVPFMALVLLTFRVGRRIRKLDSPEDSPTERAVRRSVFPSMVGFCVAAFFLSQCWSWFMFIQFAQAAAIDGLWKPAPEALEPDQEPNFGIMRA